jgi:hypothetical protein
LQRAFVHLAIEETALSWPLSSLLM